MYNSGTQVSVVSDDMSDEMGITIYICKTEGAVWTCFISSEID